MARQPIKKDDLKSALSLAVLVLEWEEETTTAPEWKREVITARQTISRALARPNPGRFFTSPDHKPKKLL